jgi:hypothetical protein
VPDSPTSPWEEAPAPRLFSPLLVALSIVLAALVGLGAGLVLVRASADDTASAGDLPSVLITPPPPPTAGPVSPPALQFPAPATSVFTLAPPAPAPAPRPSDAGARAGAGRRAGPADRPGRGGRTARP